MGSKTISIASVRWLIAETFVVVLGILIALGLDDYRTSQLERRLEIDYVERMQKDLQYDLDYIATVWDPVLIIKREALDRIAPVIRGNSPVPEYALEFLRNVSLGGALGTSATSWYRDTTFQDMRATGNLRLITDPDIRAAIAQYYESTENEALRVERRFTGYVAFVHSVMPGELRDEINLESLEEFGVDFALDRLLSDEFRALLNQEYNLLLFLEGRDFKASANNLYERLDAYRIALQNK